MNGGRLSTRPASQGGVGVQEEARLKMMSSGLVMWFSLWDGRVNRCLEQHVLPSKKDLVNKNRVIDN